MPLHTFGVLATLPSGTQALASVGEYSSPLFTDLLPFAFFGGGIFLGLGLIAFIILIIARAMSHHT